MQINQKAFAAHGEVPLKTYPSHHVSIPVLCTSWAVMDSFGCVLMVANDICWDHKSKCVAINQKR